MFEKAELEYILGCIDLMRCRTGTEVKNKSMMLLKVVDAIEQLDKKNQEIPPLPEDG